tara:strand:- start:535 stop:744 length:210 start_codon:yes stop_codon:yes gene_type:complete
MLGLRKKSDNELILSAAFLMYAKELFLCPHPYCHINSLTDSLERGAQAKFLNFVDLESKQSLFLFYNME